MKLLPIARGGGGGGGRREDEIAFSLDFYLVLSPSPLCGKINRGGFQRNRAYEMSKNGRFLWGFLRLARLLFTLFVGFIAAVVRWSRF
jgi:hypothetical protein